MTVTIDAWLPIGYVFNNNEKINIGLYEGIDWQIYKCQSSSSVLIVNDTLLDKWLETGLVEVGTFSEFNFGDVKYYFLSSPSNQILAPVTKSTSPDSVSEAFAFAEAFHRTRLIEAKTNLNDAIYIEKYTLLLPTYSVTPPISDDVLLGTWLTGGIPVSVNTFRRLKSCMTWISTQALRDVISKAGMISNASQSDSIEDGETKPKFVLPGRQELELFFNEHIIDILENEERYKLLGIDFPSAVVLYGPPGCGKTFAVEKLVEYLGLPSYEIDATSVASPFIHETSKKVAEVFEKAMQNAPSILVIDEMESFLADRQASSGSGHHRVEEVAEFLRKIPEAIKNHVLIIAMTNQIDMIDPAIMRRGRFDHVIKVDMPSEEEVLSLLNVLLSNVPCDENIKIEELAKKLKERPLSDVSFTVREGARLSAKAGLNKISQECIENALMSSPSRESEISSKRRIGF